jgi:hypothetical protein
VFEQLEKQDWYLVGIAALITVAMAVFGATRYYTLQIGSLVEFSSVIPVFAGLVFIYLSRSIWGGKIARYLEIIGAGLAVHMLLFIPHIQWHITGQTEGGMPPLIGQPPGFWYMFFHGMSLVAFLFIGYGFYLFYQEAQE